MLTENEILAYTTEIPAGYVMLVEGQKIKTGDLYCRGVGHSWHETRIKGGYWTEHGNYPMCRRRHNAERSDRIGGGSLT